MLTFAEVDENDWGGDLSVAEEQKKFVADVTVFLARAYIHHNFRPRAYIIRQCDTSVGMALYFDNEERNAYTLDQLFIDHRYQRKGYGSKALEMLLQEMRQEGKYHQVVLSYVEGDDSARKLYEKFGFRQTCQNYDEISMQLDL